MRFCHGCRHYGFCNGYQGFIPKYQRPVLELTPQSVSQINEHGGTILGTSRGQQDPVEIVDCLERMGVNVLFVDGHVEGRTDKTRNPPPSSDPPSILQLRDKEKVFDLGSTDELWDRD